MYVTPKYKDTRFVLKYIPYYKKRNNNEYGAYCKKVLKL